MSKAIFAALLLLSGVAGALLTAPGSAAAPAPALQASSEVASAGYYRLSWRWQAANLPTFEVQEAAAADFADARTVYRGRDQATVMSGRRDGEYHYRVRALPEAGPPGPWSEPVQVRVVHHPLARALGFFIAGAVVFLATLALIVHGGRRREARP